MLASAIEVFCNVVDCVVAFDNFLVFKHFRRGFLHSKNGARLWPRYCVISFEGGEVS